MVYNNEGGFMADLTFTIEQKFGILSTSNKGWNKELNSVRWNNAEAKYDIRNWSPDYTQMSKGITFSKEELIALKELLNTLEL